MAKEVELFGIMYVFTNCITCGIGYVLPRSLWDEQRQQGGFHKCPNGHSQGWDSANSEIDQLRRERDRLKQRAVQKDDAIREERERREAAERSAAAQKGQATKLRRRAAGGACPCCNRTFNNLARHMKTKHPDFGQPDNVVPLKTQQSA